MSESSRPPLLSAAGVAGARRAFEEAATLPADAFTSVDVYEREVEQVLVREWLCVGRVDQVANPGDYFTLDLLGDALVVVRDLGGTVRVLSRICRHRGAELVQGAGNRRSFQCPYHAWTFHLDGRLSGAPYMDGAKGFDKASCRLPEIRMETWQGWVFVNLDGRAEPLAERLAPLDRFLAHYDIEGSVAVETATFDSPWNWKVLVDNFMEAYHHIATHVDTLQPVMPAARSWVPDNQGPYSVLVMPSADAPNDGADHVPPDGSDHGLLVAAVVFPFHLFAVNEDSVTWYLITPEGHDRFTLRVYTCFSRDVLDDPDKRELVDGLQAITRVIHMQDIEACDATWRGLNARSFEAGVLGPLEKTIWQFNQWWLERMVDDDQVG